jgi:hypothetical protein
MPRRGRVKPTPHVGKYDKFVKVRYEVIGKRKTFEMDIPAINEINLSSVLEPIIAHRHPCKMEDVFIVDEPFMVMNIKEDSNEVQE